VIAAVGLYYPEYGHDRNEEKNHESETGHDVADLRGHRGCDLGFGYLDGHRGDRRTHLVPSTQDASAIAEGSTCSPHTASTGIDQREPSVGRANILAALARSAAVGRCVSPGVIALCCNSFAAIA
jgi:hypothetical protein